MDKIRKNIENIVEDMESGVTRQACREILDDVDSLIYEFRQDLKQQTSDKFDEGYEKGYNEGYTAGQKNYLNDLVGE